MKYLNKTIEYGLYLLVFLLPLGTRWIIKADQLNNGPWEYGVYSLYATDILLIVILSLFAIHRFLSVPNDQVLMTNDQTNSKFKILNLLIFGLVVVSAVSALFASDRLLALYKFGWLILGLGLFWLITGAVYDRIKLIYIIYAGAFLQAGLGVWQFLTQSSFANKWLGLALHQSSELGSSVIEAIGADGVGERWLRAYGGLDHPNILGGVLAIAILLLINKIIVGEKFINFQMPLYNGLNKGFTFSLRRNLGIFFGKNTTISYALKSKTFVQLLLNWLLLSVFTAGLFFSFSRSAWLALVSGLAVMIILAAAGKNLKSQKSLAEITLVMGVLLLILFGSYQNLIAARFNGEGRLEQKSNLERLASYQEAGRIIKDNWLVGAGPGNYTLELNREIPEQGSYFYQPTHNVFLLAWAEAGIFGLIFFVGVIIFLLMSNVKCQMSNRMTNGQIPMTNLPARLAEATVKRSGSQVKSQKYKLGFGNWGLGFRENGKVDDAMVSSSILIAIIVIMLFDHWLFSLHFGVLFFWLVLGLVNGNLCSKEPSARIP